jgi:predicted outer membrane repeat protein
MSEEEMQFADPDWQPPGQRKSALEQEPFHPQPLDAPREERPGWQNPPQGESDAASDSYAGYRARQQRSYSVRSVVGVLVVLLCVAFSIGTAGWFLTHQAPTPQPLTPPQSPDPTLVTNLQDDGVGSLRWAIANAPPGGTITFDRSLRGTISRPSSTPTNGRDILIGRNLTIRGPGAGVLAISGGNAGRVFDVSKGVIVTISNLTIKNGEPGEGYPNGGGIYNEGTLTLTDSTVSGNRALDGGGIDNAGTLTLINSAVSGNSATNLYASGGGIYNEGTLTLINSTISGNSALADDPHGTGYGGGIDNEGTLTLSNSTVSSNSASTSGGGIYNGGRLTLSNSSVSGNRAPAGADMAVKV